jgi:8-oxo-dGTP pyrophosphatase MutT (NUDIX family)
MHRTHLQALLAAHTPTDAREAADRDRMAAFVAAHPDCFGRSNPLGHITGSALVAAPDGRLLFLWHGKLHRWLQPGGHSDAHEHDPLQTALREATEETGLLDLAPVSPTPLDVDIHVIPARGSEPAHDHLDVRYLLRTRQPDALVMSHESRALRWFERSELGGLGFDPQLERLVGKAVKVLGL